MNKFFAIISTAALLTLSISHEVYAIKDCGKLTYNKPIPDNSKLTNKVSELWINNGKERIYGIISEPAVEGKKGVAIVSHGFNGTHHFARDYFNTLNKLGFTVYAFDYPYGSVNSRSDNNTMKMSILKQVESLKTVVKYFQQRADINKENIVLIGESQGGLVSAITAADLKDDISKLILIYPALCIPDNWNSVYPTVESIPDTTRLWNVPLGKHFFTELKTISNVYGKITQFDKPVLIVHGSHDQIVPLSYSEKAMKSYKDAHLGVIPYAKHGFNENERKLSNQFVEIFLGIYSGVLYPQE